MKRIIAVWLVVMMPVGGMIGVANLSMAAEADNGDAEIRSAAQSKSGLTAHGPIYIDGNDNFIAANGVSNPEATGTESDPYIIENWDINASSANGIEIRNTDVYFIIRNCTIHDGKSSYKYLTRSYKELS
ncbi:MAG: hypothetical protein QMD21_07895 [Candidatus Thermoplasmatota archaeon]|nr:hypothetical protein [Candidatus Thermoplasmatota archaeon]